LSEPLLRVDGLSLSLPAAGGERRQVLDGVSFDVRPGEVMGLVGESGSGKTLTALAIMRLLPSAAWLTGGQVWFEGRDLLRLPEPELRQIRGSQIAMVFQSPRSALNPLMRAGDQVARALQLQGGLSRADARREAVTLLGHVGIADAASRARAYPHQLSGGMAQRVLVAMMLACRPKLLIADEPTTGLDVTIQAQIFQLIQAVQAETGAALLLITHDLGVVSEVCQRVAVMYAGQIMELAPVADLFARPSHPYTRRLLESILRVDRPADLGNVQPLPPIPVDYASRGCHFADRCSLVRAACWEHRPAATRVGPGHEAVCHALAEAGA
jgi:oligopeptide/dipeptide ABC transporter ATP-binding protein